MRRVTRILLATLLASVALVSAANGQAPKASLPDIEDEVMCVECGTVLSVSNSPVAIQERAFIREQIAAGKDKAQIKAALVDEYGEEILAKPEARRLQRRAVDRADRAGRAGGGRHRHRGQALAPNAGEDPIETELPPELSAEDAQRLDAELSR